MKNQATTAGVNRRPDVLRVKIMSVLFQERGREMAMVSVLPWNKLDGKKSLWSRTVRIQEFDRAIRAAGRFVKRNQWEISR